MSSEKNQFNYFENGDLSLAIRGLIVLIILLIACESESLVNTLVGSTELNASVATLIRGSDTELSEVQISELLQLIEQQSDTLFTSDITQIAQGTLYLYKIINVNSWQLGVGDHFGPDQMTFRDANYDGPQWRVLDPQIIECFAKWSDLKKLAAHVGEQPRSATVSESAQHD